VIFLTSEKDHKLRMENDKVYSQNYNYLFSILKKKTAKGTALTKVKQFGKTEDGVLAWNYLKQFYDLDGNKDTYSNNCWM
jgi:hypothetical protein